MSLYATFWRALGYEVNDDEPSVPTPTTLELYYFPLYAKGLGPALVLEYSGLPYKGPKALGLNMMQHWKEMKAAGASPTGQLPLLIADGVHISQTTAILNYVGRISATEGRGTDFAVSQMLLAAGEDLYALMQKFVPTKFAKLQEGEGTLGSGKGNRAQHDEFWADTVPKEMQKLETMLNGKDAFTKTGRSVGELYLFAVLHQMVLVRPQMLESVPQLSGFYKRLLAEPKTQRVLEGESPFGTMGQYFQGL